ncbi:MAG: hypothetical protein SGPRY_010147 [Prymnesium sp.]
MVSPLLLGVLSSLLAPASLPSPLVRGCVGRRLPSLSRTSRLLAQTGSFDEELDAADTVSDWDEELAASEAFMASRKGRAGSGEVKASSPTPPADAMGNPVAEQLLQLAEQAKTRAMAEESSPPGPADAIGTKRVLTSLEAVLSQLMRLEEKVDALSAKASTGQPASPSPSPARAAEEWDGEVDDMAYFDDDDDVDLGDWRDVRRLNNLL